LVAKALTRDSRVSSVSAGGMGHASARRVAQLSTTYEPGDPTTTVLYGIVRDHFETVRAQAASLRDGDGLPRFVEQEFRDFLRCGCLAGGFARLRCAACGLDRLVAFSCRGAGSVHGVAAVGWPSGRRIWSITYLPMCRYAKPGSPPRVFCAVGWNGS
jgi:hypothetical protein